MHKSQNSSEEVSSRPRLSRRRLFFGAGAAALFAAVGGTLFRYFVSTSPMKVESFMTYGTGKKKHILILTGSSRVGGNSDLLAEAFAKGALDSGHTVDIFSTGKMRMSACLHCEGCWSTGTPCVLQDNFEKLWPLLEKAELLVFCSPLYWYNFSGHIKSAMDRLYPYSKKEKLRDLPIKEAMLLMCGESLFPRSFAGPAEAYRQMLGLKGWQDRGRLFVTGVHEQNAIKGHKALVTAEEMGRNV